MTAANSFCSTFSEELKKKMKSFRFRKTKTIAAIILKIDMKTGEVVEEEPDEDLSEECSIEQIREEISGHQPRYIVISYKYIHDDGRTSYPLFFVYFSPGGCNPEQQMRYAGTKTTLQNELGFTKAFQISDIETLTDEYLDSQAKFYR